MTGKTGKTLFVSQYVPPYPGGSSKIMEGFYRELEPGSFTVLSEELQGDKKWQGSEVASHIHWLPAMPYGARGNLKRILAVKKEVTRLLRTGEYDRVWLVYPSPAFLVGGYLACRKVGIPYAVYMHDTWGEAVQHKSWPHRLLAARYEKKIMAGADQVFAISQGFGEYLSKTINREVLSLPHPVEGKLGFDPEVPLEFTDAGAPLKFAFTGGVYLMNSQSLNLVVSALKSWGKPFEFFLSTQTPKAELENLGVDLDAIETCFFPAYSDYQDFLAGIDVFVSCISFQSALASEERLTAMPTKTFEYTRLGQPLLVVAPEESVTAQHALSRQYAMVCTENSEAVLHGLFERMIGDREWVDGMRKKQAELFRKHQPRFLLESIAGPWVDLKES